MRYRIETDRFMWGGTDTYATLKEARADVREFLQSCRDNGQRGWYKTDLYEPDVIVEYEHVAWDPTKPDRVRIVRIEQDSPQ